MKITAVDWLFMRLWIEPKDKFAWRSILDKATEMHKEEIIDAFKAGAFYEGYELEAEQYYFEKYYNETYGDDT